MTARQTVNIGLIGFGTVGAGVARALLQKGRLLEDRIGVRLRLRRVCDRDFRRSRGFRLPAGLSTSAPARGHRPVQTTTRETT